MWAAFTSDLKEFASSAAEETTAVASKVGVNIGGDVDNISGGLDHNDNGGGYTSSTSNSSSGGQQQQRRSDGSVLLANAAFSMGEKGLKGLSSVGSIMGGIVAPREAAAVIATNNSSASSFASNKPSSALSSMMLAAEDDDEEEEELGWDDDDDDLDVDSGDDDGEGGDVKNTGDDFFEEHLGDGEGKNSSSQLFGNTKTVSSEDEQVLRALQSKLGTVEKARAELQNEHRMQTAELVELRARVEELEQQQPATAVGRSGEKEEEVHALQHEIDLLKAQLNGQSKDAVSNEHGNKVTALIQEKEDLERELSSQKEQNDQLLQRNQTLQSQDDGDNNSEQDLLLQKYQQQIKDLTSELETLQSNLNSTSVELTEVKKHSTQQDITHLGEMQEQQLQLAQTTRGLEQSLSQIEASRTRALKEAEEAKAKLLDMEKEVLIAKEMEDQAAQFEEKLQGEIEKMKAEGLVAAAADVVPKAASSAEMQEQEKETLDDTSFKTPNNSDVLQEEKASSDSSSPVVVQDEKESSDISSPVKLDSNEEEDDELSEDWGDADSGEW